MSDDPVVNAGDGRAGGTWRDNGKKKYFARPLSFSGARFREQYGNVLHFRAAFVCRAIYSRFSHCCVSANPPHAVFFSPKQNHSPYAYIPLCFRHSIWSFDRHPDTPASVICRRRIIIFFFSPTQIFASKRVLDNTLDRLARTFTRTWFSTLTPSAFLTVLTGCRQCVVLERSVRYRNFGSFRVRLRARRGFSERGAIGATASPVCLYYII